MMPEDTKSIPLLDRSLLEEQFGKYEKGAEPLLPNIPFQGLDNPLPNSIDSDKKSLSALEIFENNIFSGSSGDGKLRGGGIPRSLEEVTSNRFQEFVPGTYNNEDAYAQGQGFGSKMVNGVGKGLLLTGTTFLQSTAGLLNGVAQWINDGRASSFYDNDMNRALDKLNVAAEDVLPNYYKDTERDAHWYSPSKLFSANFLWDGIVKNLGFAAGAALSGGAFATALRALPLTAKLFSVGKAAEALQATETAALGAGRAAETYGKVKSLSDGFLSSFKVLNTGGRALVAGLATTGEAGFEAYHNLNEFRNSLIKEYQDSHNGLYPKGEDLEDINRTSDTVGNSSFLLNAALLSVTNYIQFPKILGSSYTAERGQINSLPRQIDDIVEEAGKFKAAPSRLGKVGTALNAIRPYTFSTSEGFEEGAQYAITKGTQDYYNKKYNNEDTDFFDSLYEGVSQTIGTDEGMENVVIGGLSGALMLGRGRYRESSQKSRNTKEAVDAFNKYRLSDFTRETKESVNRGVALQTEREKLLKDGNISDSKDKEMDYIINYLAPRVKYGRMDLVTSEINDYKVLASTEAGFSQLQAEGKALDTDTREAYMNRLLGFEATANNVKSLYQSLHLRYGSLIDDKGKPLYSSAVMDKMVYAATKVADYDIRIPQLSYKLVAAGINTTDVIQDILDGKNDKYNAAIAQIDALKLVDGDPLKQDLLDLGKLSLRRNKFLQEYDDIKNNPKKHQEQVEEPIKPGEESQVVKLTTKTGEKELTTRTEYFVGKGFDYDKEGLETPVAISKLTILKDNGDGTIKIKTNTGEIRDISKQELLDYKITRVDQLRANKTANYFFHHRNDVFEINLGAKYGGKKQGRIEYKDDKLYIVYKGLKGKLIRKSIDNSFFVAQKNFKEPRVKVVGKVRNAEEQKAQDEFVSEEELKAQKQTAAQNRDTRIEILTQLFDDITKEQEVTDKLLVQKKAELENITRELTVLEEQVLAAQDDIDKRFKKITFKSATKKALNAATRLSKMQEQLTEEVGKLEARREELDVDLEYISDMAQNIDELPTNSKEFLNELRAHKDLLEDMILNTSIEIEGINKVITKVKEALDSAIDFLADLVHQFQKKFPKVPLILGQGWIDFLGNNPNFLKRKPNYKEELQQLDDLVAQVEDLDIIPGERTIKELNQNLSELQESLSTLEKELKVSNVILERFEEIAEKHKQLKAEEAAMQVKEEELRKVLGTTKSGLQNVESRDDYEPEAKKDKDIIAHATTTTGDKPHAIRSNKFGVKLESFSNREDVRGVYITAQNEDQLIPGLLDHLRTDENGNVDTSIDREQIIVLVMVDTEGNLLGVDGQPLAEGVDKIENAIYQTFPLEDLEWSNEYGKESMFRKGTTDTEKTAIKEQYAKKRERILKNTKDLSEVHKIKASFGFPDYIEYLDDEQKRHKVYTTRTSVEDAGLITIDDLEKGAVITIPTTNPILSKGTVTFREAIGKVFLELKNAVIKLQNRLHTKAEAETIYQALYHLAKDMLDPDVGIGSDHAENLFNYLRSVVYWGIPKDQQGNRKPAGYNSIFWEKDPETGKFMLSMSGLGKNFVFTPSSLEKNKQQIIDILEKMYNNVNSSMVKNTEEPYAEVISISPDGTINNRMWKNYQTYLLSKTAPDGKVRSGEELPLATAMRPLEGEDDVNRSGVYFYTTDTADDIVMPTAKRGVIPEKIKPGAPPKPQEAPKKEAPAKKPEAKDTSIYKLDSKSVYIYTTPRKRALQFVVKEGITSKNYLDKIVVVRRSPDDPDFDAAVKDAKDAGLDPATVIKKEIFKLIRPQLEDESETSYTYTGETETAEVLEQEEETYTYTGEEDSDEMKAALGGDVDPKDLIATRLIVEEKLKGQEEENWPAITAWMKANMPNFPLYRVKNVIQATNGRQAWGMFKDAALYVYQHAEAGTTYHEIFHGVWRMFTDSEEQAKILAEVRQRKGIFFDSRTLKDINYSDATDKQLEEVLADEFKDYVQSGKIPGKPSEGRSFIAGMFADLVQFIKEFFTGKNATNNTYELFKRIGTGYYKDSIPYTASLSFAKKGIIDIEDAFGDIDTDFSLITITDKQRSEIIQEMTYQTLKGLINTDKSLFTIPELKKSELYDDLKKKILKTLAIEVKVTEEKIENKEITRKQGAPIIEPRKTLMRNVIKEWDATVEKHQEYLRGYSIEFDENDTLQINDEDKIKESNFVDATKIDSFKKANSAIKLLLATIPKVSDSEGHLVLSSIGGATLIPISQTYINLMNKLHRSRNVEEMMKSLRDMAKKDSNYIALFNRVSKADWTEKGDVDLSGVKTTHGAQLLGSFWGTFKKMNPEVKNVFIYENGDVTIGDANLSTAASQIRDEYRNSFITAVKKGQSYFTYHEKEKAFFGNPVAIKNIRLDTISSYVDFLRKMGINFTVSDLKEKLNDTQLKEFREIVSGIRESLSKAEKIMTFSGNVLRMNGRLLELGAIQAIINNPEFDSTFFNVSGERVQSFIGVNPADALFNFLSGLEKYDELHVANSEFRYLWTDVFANRKSSNILQRKFTEDGTPKTGAEDLMKVGYVSGTSNEKNGKKKASAKLTYKERLVQEISLNLKGWYLNLVPADSTTEWMIKLGNPISTASISRGMEDINSIFKGYFISEIELLREKRTINSHRDPKEAKSMRFFKVILGKELHNELIKSKASAEKLYNDNEGRINTALDKFIKDETSKFEKTLEVYGILTKGDHGYSAGNTSLPENMDEATKNRQLKALTVNYMIANIELHKLLYSDPYQYYQELKRIKNFNSPRQALISGSPRMNAIFNDVWNHGYEKGDIGYTNFNQDYFRSATHKDTDGIIDLSGYIGYKETDGAGIIGMRAYRQFRIRVGNWNDNEEKQYRYDMAWEKEDKVFELSKTMSGKDLQDEIVKRGLNLSEQEVAILEKGNPAVQSAYVNLKPIVAGNRLNSKGEPNDINDVVLDKFALYALSYRIMKELNPDANIVKLYNKMQRENIDYMVFEKSRVVGANEPVETYNEDGSFNETPYPKGNVINIPFSIISVQSEVPSKEKALTTRGSQMTKLVTMDFMDAGVPVDFSPQGKFSDRYKAWYSLADDTAREIASPLYKEIKNNQNLLEALMAHGYNSLLKRLGVQEEVITEPNGKKTHKFSVVDFSNAVATLRDEVLKREVNDNISLALTDFLGGKTILEATPVGQQVKHILYSIADKEVISPKISGGMKVQIPSTMLESVRAASDGKGHYTSDVLNFYQDEDGKRVCEIMVGRWFKSSLSDQELLDYLNSEEGKKILSGVAFRIPTQKQNSIDSFVIKQFLPKEFGDSVVVPAALVEKAGSDFDIDKLSIYFKNLKVNKKGQPIYIDYLTDENSTVEERYAKWVAEKANKDAKKYIKFLAKAEVANLRSRFKARFEQLNQEYHQLVSSAKEIAYDELLESYKSIREDVFTSQDQYIEELFEQGRGLFRTLQTVIKDAYFRVKQMNFENDINGPDELKNYLLLTHTILENPGLTEKEVNTLNGMISLYEEELRVLGSTDAEIDSLKKEALDNFRSHKSTSIQNIGETISNMTDLLKRERSAEVSEFDLNYAIELAGASNLLSLEAFRQEPIMMQNTKKALENAYIQSSQNLVSHPSNFDKLVKPNSAEQMKALSKEIAKKVKGYTFDYDEVGNMLDRSFMSSLRHAFVSGKYAIGIAAVNQTNHSLNQRQPIYIDTDRLSKVSTEDKFWLGDAKIKFEKFNTLEVENKVVPTLSGIRNQERSKEYPMGQYISDIISQFIDGFVDIAKGPWIMEMGATPSVVSTWLFLVKLGVPINTVAYFMNQPIIVDYLNKITDAGYSWLFIDNFIKDIESEKKWKLSKQMEADLESVGFKGMGLDKIPNESTLRANLEKNETTLKPDLEKNKFTEQEKIEQRFMLHEFLKYAKMANHMFLVTQGSNFDTANFNDQYLVFKKFEQLKKAQNTIISSVDDILNNSFIGKLGDTLKEMRNALATILKSDQKRVRGVIENVLRPYVDMNDNDFLKLAQKAVNDLFDWAVQTDENGTLCAAIKDIMISDGGFATEMMDFIKSVEDNPSHPLYGNDIIRLAKAIPSPKVQTGGVNNLKIKGRDNKIYDQNNIIYAFRELRDFLGEDSSMYKRLKLLAILQSGLSSSAISFTSLLPYEDFEKMYSKTLSKIDTIPNLESFYELGVFERNNWGNDDITPYLRARYIKISDGTQRYNPAMNFLDDTVKLSVKNKKIPPVMSLTIHNREANSDYVVYTWEMEDELLTQVEKDEANKNGVKFYKSVQLKKANMRKAGDMSFIQRGLFKKVYYENSAEPLISKDKKGNFYFIYKAVNAWGDSYRANEFYITDHKSVIDNGFIKVEDVRNSAITNLFDAVALKDKAKVLYNGSIKLSDGKTYTPAQINGKLLEGIGYSPNEIGKILKLIC